MKTLRIEFEDQPGHILTIVSPVSLDAYFTVREAYEAGNWGERASFTALFAAWAPFIRSWSYKAPVSPESMAGLDPHPLLAAVKAWLDGVRDVPLPLPRASSATAPSE